LSLRLLPDPEQNKYRHAYITKRFSEKPSDLLLQPKQPLFLGCPNGAEVKDHFRFLEESMLFRSATGWLILLLWGSDPYRDFPRQPVDIGSTPPKLLRPIPFYSYGQCRPA